MTGDVISAVQKLFRVGGAIVGCAGDEENILTFEEWVRAGMNQKKRPTFGDGDFEAMLLNAEGIWLLGKGLRPHRILDEYHAIGSGAMAAKAAMHLGHKPDIAVQVASSVDECTGFDVDVLHLKPKRKSKPKIDEYRRAMRDD